MCFWVFGAGSQRLAHLALIRRSDASMRFFRRGLVAFAVAAALFAFTQFGWHHVKPAPDPAVAKANAQPGGNGWHRVAVAPSNITTRHTRSAPTALWWNLPSFAIALPTSFVTALLVGWLLLAILGACANKALAPPYRGEGRFGAALRYGSAWSLWTLAAGLISLVLPLCYAQEVTGWAFIPQRLSVYLVAATIACAGLLMGWFWLIRVGGTVPPATRTRVALVFVLWAPLITGGLVGGWWVGMVYGSRLLFPALKLHW